MSTTCAHPDATHHDAAHARLSQAQGLGHEARGRSGDHAALKLWLRLLACTKQIETEIRGRLRMRFGVSLARFDYLAQLHRSPEGLMMRDLSQFLMVSGGNVTGLTDELESAGLVTRERSPTDRRSWIVRLSAKGRQSFEAMAHEHEQWVLELFGSLDAAALQRLYAGLGALRVDMLPPAATAAVAAQATPRG